MKYIALLLGLFMILPLVSALRRNDRYVPLTWQIVGVICFLLPTVPWLGITMISWRIYPGQTKGFEVTVIDILMVAIFISQRSKPVIANIPFRLLMKLYFCVVTFSAFYAQIPMAALFYSWQLLRMYLVFIVVARACADERVAPALLRGLAIGLLAEACLVLYQKYGLGTFQPSGTFPHQNALGLVTNMVTIPFVSLLLANRSSWLISAAPVGGFVIAALTASRATMGLAGLGVILAFLQSIANKVTPRKFKLGVVGILLAAVVVPIGFSSFQNRLAQQADAGSGYSGYDERAAYINAASLMLTDHPLGVGANNFNVTANSQGYYDRAQVAAVYGSRSGLVHNVYWLTLGEVGYAGFFTLLLVLVLPLYVALRSSWRFRDHPEGSLLGGLGLALLLTYTHSYYEWILATSVTQYFLAIIFGLVAGVSTRLSNKSPRQLDALRQVEN